MHHLNPKYLLSRYRWCKVNQSWTISEADRYDKEFLDETFADTKTTIKYDGYVFNASLKTIKSEITRRFNLGEIHYSNRRQWPYWGLTINKNKKQNETTNKSRCVRN